MDSKTQNYHDYVLSEDWFSHGYTRFDHREEKVGSKLTNEIHSMFGYELNDLPHGEHSKARWGELTLEEYKLLDQPLRLATQWLESAPSSDAICSISYGDRYTPSDSPTFKGRLVSEFSKHSLPGAVVREKAANVLKRLGNSVMFQLTDRDAYTKLEEGTHGRTSALTVYHPEGIAVTDSPEKKGLASMVCIIPTYLTLLKELLNDPQNKRFQILKLYFELALTICHEVTHAIDFAVEFGLLKSYIEMGRKFHGVPFSEPFHKGQRVAEIGFFWENHVFGGACNQSIPNPEDVVFLVEWPSWVYRDKEANPERAPPRKLCFKWLVSIYYIQNSLIQEFWDEVKLQYPNDLLALRMRKTIGFKCESQGDDYDKTWNHNAPHNNPKGQGHPLRVPWNEADPSPCSRLANDKRS